MNRVTITLLIDLPEGVVPLVEYGTANVPAQHTYEGQPETPPPLGELPAPTAQNTLMCPDHHKPYKNGTRGFYCPTKTGEDASGKTLWCQRKPA